jgi:hypothetical protein
VGLCGLVLSVPILGFYGATHKKVTEDTLKNSCRTIGSANLCFTSDAIAQVVKANNEVDNLAGQVQPTWHFDAESFHDASNRLVDLKQQILQKITEDHPDGSGARDLLGQALHAVQDFYAHSSWVDNFSDINYKLGRSVFSPGDPGPPPVANLTDATCPTDHYTLDKIGPKVLTSGYFQLTSPCYFGPDTLWKCGHGGFATWPLSCPNGLSKDEVGRPNFQKASDAAGSATVDFVSQILDDPSVSGNAKATKALMGLNIGTLGFVIDDTGSMGDIIADVRAQVNAIVDSVAGTDQAPSQYLLEPFNDPTVGPPTATGDATAFEAAVDALYADGGGDCPELAMSGLLQAIAASDPGATLFLFTDADAKDDDQASNVAFAAQAKGIKINFALFGNCGEYGDSAARKPRPRISSTSPHDPASFQVGSQKIVRHKADQVTASDYDPAFFKVGSQTGGQVFLLAGSEAGAITNLVTPQLGQHPVSLLSVADVLSSGDTRDYVIPIDSTVTSVTFSISIDTPGTIQVTRPSGAAVTAGAGVTITTLSTGEIVTVTAPETGNWGLHVSGTGNLSVTVLAKTNVAVQNGSIEFTDVGFVQVNTNFPHPYYFPIPGQPVIGTTQTLLVDLAGPYATANFQLLDSTGKLIQALALSQGTDPYAGSSSFLGTFTAPTQPFRVAASGTDSAGNAYFRVFPQLFTAQSVQVTATTAIGTLTPGSSGSLTFSVQNLGGSSDTFNITVTDSCGTATGCGFITGTSPSQLTLDAGASGTVTVQLAVPLGAVLGTVDIVSVSATSASNPNVTNGATQSFSVAAGPVVTPSTSALSFPDQLLGTASAALPVTVTNSGTANLTISTVAISGANLTNFATSADTCSGATVTPSGTCSVSVTFTPSAIGIRSASLNFTDNASGSPQTVSLSGNGIGAVVSLSSSSLTFPAQMSGTSSTAQTVTLTNAGNASLTISGITASGDFSQTNTCGTSVIASANCTISVTFKPVAGGTRSGTLSISDSAFDSPQSVALGGTGQDFSFTVPSGSSTSATVAPGASATYTLSVGGQGGFNQSVSFTCTGAPSEATCTVSPNPVTAGSSATNITVTATTTAASVSAPQSRPLPPVPPLSPGLRGLLMLGLALAAMAWAMGRRNRPGVSRWQSRMALLASGLLLILALAGCGGGGGSSNVTHDPGTPAGTSKLTVTGSTGSGSSALSHSVTLTLTVS